MAEAISIAIPVGPFKANTKWLPRAVDSIIEQITWRDEICFIVNRPTIDRPRYLVTAIEYLMKSDHGFSVVDLRHPIGVPAGFNLGVMHSRNRHVLMMGSDDQLLPGCLDACRDAIEKHDNPLNWYYLGVQYPDGRTQNTPCNASVVSKKLWEFTGGFPVESSVGQCDTVLISALMKNQSGLWPGQFIQVSKEPLYLYNDHEETDTNTKKAWKGIAGQVRDKFTEEWRPYPYGKQD